MKNENGTVVDGEIRIDSDDVRIEFPAGSLGEIALSLGGEAFVTFDRGAAIREETVGLLSTDNDENIAGFREIVREVDRATDEGKALFAAANEAAALLELGTVARVFVPVDSGSAEVFAVVASDEIPPTLRNS